MVVAPSSPDHVIEHKGVPIIIVNHISMPFSAILQYSSALQFLGSYEPRLITSFLNLTYVSICHELVTFQIHKLYSFWRLCHTKIISSLYTDPVVINFVYPIKQLLQQDITLSVTIVILWSMQLYCGHEDNQCGGEIFLCKNYDMTTLTRGKTFMFNRLHIEM